MSKRGNNQFEKKSKEPLFKKWNSRFSAGGANRTNVHDQLRRLSSKDEYSPYYDYQSPIRSRFYSNHKLPADRYDYRRDEDYRRDDDLSPSQFRDSKGRKMQKIGLFRNAKHSHLILPRIDEKTVRTAEETIRKLTRPQKHDEDWSRYRPSMSNEVQNRVRQVVYEMNIPDNYRKEKRRSSIHEGYSKRQLFPSHPESIIRYSNPKRNVLYDSGYEPRSIDRNRRGFDQRFYRKHDELKRRKYEYEEIDDQVDLSSEKYEQKIKRNEMWRNKDQQRRDSQNSNHSSTNFISNTLKNQNFMLSNQDDSLISESRERTAENLEINQYNEQSSNKTESKKYSKPVYIVEKDDNIELNWEEALKTFNDRNSDGLKILKRIGNSMPPLSLVDNTDQCYSNVAFMLIKKTMKKNQEQHKINENDADVFDKLKNMSTSWVTSKDIENSTILAKGGEFPQQKTTPKQCLNNCRSETSKKAIMNDISRIRNPQSLLVENDETMFQNSRFFQSNKLYSNNKNDVRPVFRSSPISNDFQKSNDLATLPSSIRNQNSTEEEILNKKNEKNLMNLLNESEMSEEYEDYDIDNYIEKGASKLSFIATPEIASSSGQKSINNDLSSQFEMENLNFMNETVEDSQQKNFEHNNNNNNLLFNEEFNFTISNDKSPQPMITIDPETQRIFDNAYEEYQNRLSQSKENSFEHLFQ